jgi:hypothetical protein
MELQISRKLSFRLSRIAEPELSGRLWNILERSGKF